MDTDWTTIEGAGKKREYIKQNPRYYYKRHHKKHDEETKENVGPGISKREEDNLALKIHGLYYESDNNSSDSGKSSFDEEYYKYKPQPIEINSSQVVVIRNKNIIKEQGNRNETNHNMKHPRKKRGIPNKGRNINSNHKKGTPRIAVNEGAFEVNKNTGKGSTSNKSIFTISDKCDSSIPISNAGNQSESSSFWNNSFGEPKISETQYDSILIKSTMFFSAQHQSNNKTTPMDSDYPQRDKKLRTEIPKTPLMNSVQQHLVHSVPNEEKIYNDTYNRFSNVLNEAVNHLMHMYSEQNQSKRIQEASNREQNILEVASKKQPGPKTPVTQKNTFLRFGSNEASNASSNCSETVIENSAKEKIDIARAHVNKIEVEKGKYPWVAKEYTIRDVWKTPKDQEIKPATPKLESYNEIVPKNDILISNNKTIMRHPQYPQNETANNLLYALDEDEPRHSPAEFSKVYVPTARNQPGWNRAVAEENNIMDKSKTRKDPQIKPGTPKLKSNTRIVPKNNISTISIEAIVQQPQNPLNERNDNLSPIMRNEISEPSIAQEDDINLLTGVRGGGLLAALSLTCCCCSKVHIG